MQTACFAAGIWLQHFSITWTTREAIWKQTIEELDAQLARVVQALPPNGAWSADSSVDAAIRPMLGWSSGSGVLLLDANWRITGSVPAQKGSKEIPHQTIHWEDRTTSARLSVTGKIGTFALQDGLHLGVLREIGNRFVVAHRSQSDAEAQLASVLAGLTGVSVTTLIWTTALMGIFAYMAAGKFCDEVDRERSKANVETLRQRQNLIRTRDAVIFGLARLTESRDPETGNHLDRISMYATTLATALMHHPDFKDDVTPAFVKLIGISAALHDIGKVGVEDKILLKPGKLTPAERATMEDHCRIGGECLREIERRLGRSNFLHMARDIAFAHHEHWDGGGYPYGLRGEQIPLAARIVAIADVYDALASRRVYKEPQPHEQCVATVRSGSGTHFDPRLIEIWLTVAERFREIAERFGDPRTKVFSEQQDRESTDAKGSGHEFYRTLEPSAAAAGGFKPNL